MRHHLFKGILLGAMLAASVALAQVSPPNPYNQSLIDTTVVPSATVLHTFTAAAPATFNSGILQNLQGKGVQCKYNRTAESGSPSSIMNIQAWDAASATFTTWLATTGLATPTGELIAQVYPGIQTTGLPANMVAIALHLPKWFRVQVVTTGANTQHTATLGCDQLQ